MPTSDFKQLYHSLRIGNRIVEGNIALAPMAGVTDRVFRTICRRQGASLVCTELVSARGIRYDPGLIRSWRYLSISGEEEPVAIQLFGSDPADFEYAIPVILEHPELAGLFAVDINMGCPVSKVTRTGAGSALMKDPIRAGQVVRSAVRSAGSRGIPVTVKIRSGWNAQQCNAAEVARIVEDAGAAAVTVHARTTDQMYTGRADWTVIAAVKEAVHIPVFGNGDVVDGESALSMLRQTGADGVAVGRAALGNPWVFAGIQAAMLGNDRPLPPTVQDRAGAIREEMTARITSMGERQALREMRKVTVWYLKGTPHAAELRRRAVTVETAVQLEQLLRDWICLTQVE